MINSFTLFMMGVLAVSEKDITQDYIFKHQGLWMHPSKQYAVRFAGCEDGMCGTIAWVADHAVKHDVNNTDETLKVRPLCGLRIVNGLVQDGHVNIFKKGKMYRTDKGTMSSAKASYFSSDEMQLHSYHGVSMIGDSMIWERVSEQAYPPCTPVQPLTVSAPMQEDDTIQEDKTLSQPVSIIPEAASKPMPATSEEAPRTASSTNTNFKTRAMPQQDERMASSFEAAPTAQKQSSHSAPRTMTLDVIE